MTDGQGRGVAAEPSARPAPVGAVGAPDGEWEFVYFAPIDWGYTWQRPQQLASRLARHGRLLYVNPLGIRAPRPQDIRRLAQRMAGRLGRAAEPAPGPGARVESLWLYLPFPASPLARRLNAARLRRLVRRWRPRDRGGPRVLWVGTPSAAVVEALEGLEPATVVYDCLDHVAAFQPGESGLGEVEARLATRADVVFATARSLYERMRALNPATVWLPNGADYAHFARARDPGLPVPRDVAGISRPVLGYMGEIADWFNLELVDTLARDHPAWHVVLIGVVHTPAAARLLARPNVHYLGRKGYADLPAYVGRFDVCLLPFRRTALTDAVNPVKLYEYLAAGRPVVSTPLPEVARHGDVVTVAEPGEFGAAVARALRTADDPAAVARRLAVARENTWERRVETILEVLGRTRAGG